MLCQQDIEEKALQEFQFLVTEAHFNSPIATRTNWKTGLDYLGDSFAFEVELDWQEMSVFLLLVRLDNRKLPNGYYVTDGRKCRVHLVNVLSTYNCITPEELSRIHMAGATPSAKPGPERMIHQLMVYSSLVKNKLDFVFEHKDDLFH